jgi:hypothetical protein
VTRLGTQSRPPLELFGPSVISIYVDESGRPGSSEPFAVGGLILIAPNGDRLAKLDRELLARDLVWGLASGSPPVTEQGPIPKHFLEKNPQDYRDPLARLDELFEELSIDIAAFALVDRGTRVVAPAGLSDILDERQIDNLYRAMLAESLEAVLFDVIPEWGRATLVATHVATRENVTMERKRRDELREKFGIVFSAPRQANVDGSSVTVYPYYSLGHSEVYPIVARVLSKRPNAGGSVPVEIARGVTLHDFGQLSEFRDSGDQKKQERYKKWVTDKINPRPDQIHYLADWLVRLARRESVPRTAAKWFSRGFLQDRNPAFASWLEAGRAADRGDYLEAAAEIARSRATTERFSECAFARWTRAHIATWMKGITGPELMTLCHRIDAVNRARP